MMLLAVMVPISYKAEEKITIKAMAKGLDIYNHNLHNNTQEKYNYVAILEIPKISLYQGLVDKSSRYNDIKYNIAILSGSSLPDTKYSNLILAAHNGTSNVSFFKNLDKLIVSDNVNIYYQQNKYTYIIDHIYEVPKTGMVEIVRDSNKTTITLITCKKNDEEKQLVLVGYLI